MFRNRFWVSLVLSIPVLLFSPMIQQWVGFSLPAFPGSRWIGPIFAIAIYFYGGLPFLKLARPEIRNRRPGMMTLISLAITVAFLYSLYAVFFSFGSSFFWEMATLIDVMLLGHWFEMRSVRQASGALNELAKLMPDTAERIRADGETDEVAVSALQPGDLVLVRPGASVPVDGEVAEGHSAVSEAMITGEARPVNKEPGDPVIGGTINGDGSLQVRVTATGDETALAGIMRLVEQAQQSKSDTQILADKAAGWLFYIAVAVAAVTSVAWIIAIGFDLTVVERAVTVLVIACPHALGLAIPLVVAISTSKGASSGILVRDRLALEEARELDTVIFDKTGTLTEGAFGVVAMTTADGWDGDQALALATAVEGHSEHLIAKGIRRKAEERGVEPPQVSDFEAIKGRGIRARSNGTTLHVGGPRLLEMLDLSLPDSIARFTSEAGEEGQSVVYLVNEKQPVAAFALADIVRPESKQAINRLQEMGVEVAMLTGDSQAVAGAVAEELGIDTYFAEVLPEHKDQRVGELMRQGRRVAMVGDGVNDAPALTRADVGIAIGSGTDVAIEAADIILVQNNPLDVVKIFELSRATYRKMIQNLIWATGYNIVAIPLAAGILAPFGSGFLLSPALGALFMSLSTVIVAINAQTLRRVQLGV
jgi:Cu2+-exporting ATPase